MDKYRLEGHELPPYLYRIHYPKSQTIYSPGKGLSAPNTTKAYSEQDLNDFKADIEKQFKSSCRESLPFINLFSIIEHAENWGLKQSWRGAHNGDGGGGGGDDWTLFKIDTKLLEASSCVLFRLRDLVNGLNLNNHIRAEEHFDDAYLCLHAIPDSAIVDAKGPRGVQLGIHICL